MKVLALVLLCAVAAVQGRSTGVESGRNAAALGENPWLVHLRVAIATSGLLESCVGSVIDGRWVLTAASCVSNARFIWVRYGAVDVISPQLVTETSAVRVHPGYDAATGANDIALVSLNRYVLKPSNEHISTVSLAGNGAEQPAAAKFCTYGADEDSNAGDFLSCVNVEVNVNDDGSLSADAESTNFDLGAPLVQDGVQYGILTNAGDSSSFLNPAAYLDWIQETAGIQFPGPDADGDADGDGDADADADGEDEDNEGLSINFVN